MAPVYSRPHVTDSSTSAPAWVSFARASRPRPGAETATPDPAHLRPGLHNVIRPRLVCSGPFFSRLNGPGTARPSNMFSGATRPRILTLGHGRPRAARPQAHPGMPAMIPPAAAQTMTPHPGGAGASSYNTRDAEGSSLHTRGAGASSLHTRGAGASSPHTRGAEASSYIPAVNAGSSSSLPDATMGSSTSNSGSSSGGASSSSRPLSVTRSRSSFTRNTRSFPSMSRNTRYATIPPPGSSQVRSPPLVTVRPSQSLPLASAGQLLSPGLDTRHSHTTSAAHLTLGSRLRKASYYDVTSVSGLVTSVGAMAVAIWRLCHTLTPEREADMIITPHVATMGFSTIPTLEHSSVQSILLALGGAIGLTGVGTTMRGHSKKDSRLVAGGILVLGVGLCVIVASVILASVDSDIAVLISGFLAASALAALAFVAAKERHGRRGYTIN